MTQGPVNQVSSSGRITTIDETMTTHTGYKFVNRSMARWNLINGDGQFVPFAAP